MNTSAKTHAFISVVPSVCVKHSERTHTHREFWIRPFFMHSYEFTNTGINAVWGMRDGKLSYLMGETHACERDERRFACKSIERGLLLHIHALAIHAHTHQHKHNSWNLCVFVEETDRHINSRRLTKRERFKTCTSNSIANGAVLCVPVHVSVWLCESERVSVTSKTNETPPREQSQ